MRTRAEALRNVQASVFDVCVIGAGATGSGCALDAQLRGLKTVLLDAGDFASGTSSTSTKMAHGGVRYLEQAVLRFDTAEYDVVRRALRERIRMLRNAPFLCRPMEFVTPCFGWSDVAYYETGLKLYDWISGSASLGRSRFISREETLRLMPTLAQEGLRGAVSYVDGQFDDARYNITLANTFADAGGECLNYARLIAFEKDAEGKIASAEIEDQLSGSRFHVCAKAFVNATGPRADAIRTIATPGIPPRMRLSKGVHILLSLEILSATEAMLIPKTEDGRVLFAIPWQGRLLVGTTENEISAEADLFLTREEVEYLLRHLNRYLKRPVAPDQVVSGMAGARPLVAPADMRNTKEVAREHEVEIDQRSGLISIMGGKWTTYRAMAEDTIDAVEKYMHRHVTPTMTKDHALIGSDGYTGDYWRSLVKEFSIPEIAARHLAEKFGTRAPDVMKLTNENHALRAPLIAGLAYLQAEVLFCARDEMAMCIEDILARRLGVEGYGWQEAIQAAPVVADLLGHEFGWAPEKKQTAIDAYVRRIRGLIEKAGIAPTPVA